MAETESTEQVDEAVSDFQNVCVYGLGDFGLGFVHHFDRLLDHHSKDFTVTAYARNSNDIQYIKRHGKHPSRFQAVDLPDGDRITYTSDQDATKQADLVVMAVPSSSTHLVLKSIKSNLKPGVVILNTAKALDDQTGERLSEVYERELAGVDYKYGLFAGFTMAKDMVSREALAADIGAQNIETAQLVASFMSLEGVFDLYPTDDLIGVEFAGALKNVVSVIAGIAVSEADQEVGAAIDSVSQAVAKICVSLGAQSQTFSNESQCWGEDMRGSATKQTRNRQFGELLGQGKSVDEALGEMKRLGKTVESAATLEVLLKRYPAFAQIQQIQDLHELFIGLTQNNSQTSK